MNNPALPHGPRPQAAVRAGSHRGGERPREFFFAKISCNPLKSPNSDEENPRKSKLFQPSKTELLRRNGHAPRKAKNQVGRTLADRGPRRVARRDRRAPGRRAAGPGNRHARAQRSHEAPAGAAACADEETAARGWLEPEADNIMLGIYRKDNAYFSKILNIMIVLKSIHGATVMWRCIHRRNILRTFA